jgi:hypothetical protein
MVRGIIMNSKGPVDEETTRVDAKTDISECGSQLVRRDVTAVVGNQFVVCKGIMNGAWSP